MLANSDSAIGSTVISILYGTSLDAPTRAGMVDAVNRFSRRVARTGAPGEYLVEVFPVMRHLPEWLAPWKRRLNAWYREDCALFMGYVDDVQRALVSVLVIIFPAIFHCSGNRPTDRVRNATLHDSWKMQRKMACLEYSSLGYPLWCCKSGPCRLSAF